MSQAQFLPLIDPIASTLARLQRQAWDEFDQNISNGAYRLTIEGARPKAVNERTFHLLEMEYGRKGKIRVVVENDLRYLLLVGRDFDIGIRPKKLDSSWRSYQHSSLQQDDLRNEGYFSWAQKKTFYLFLGYRDAGEIEKRLTHVAITWERTGQKVEIIKMLWNEADGTTPITEFQPDFDTPPKPRIRARRRKDSGSQDAANG